MYQELAWTPDDKGLLTWDNLDGFTSPPAGRLLYVDLGTATATTLLTETGRVIESVAVDQHWDAFLSTSNRPDPAAIGPRMEAAWLGDPGKITVLPNAYHDSSGGNIPSYWSFGPSVARPARPTRARRASRLPARRSRPRRHHRLTRR